MNDRRQRSRNGECPPAGRKFYYTKVFLACELILLAFLGVFYFSCGKQLYVRESDGNIDEFYATNDVGELAQGVAAEQVYTSQMDMIDTVGVMASNYSRPMDCQLYIHCEDAVDGHLIAEQAFDAGTLGVNQYVYLDIPEGIEEPRGRQVKIICTSNGTPGNAPTVLYNAENKFGSPDVARDAQLSAGGSALAGSMCIAVRGRDFVWTGPNYWKLVLFAAVLFAAAYGIEAARSKKGKQTLIFGVMHVWEKYSFLARQLVQRDFKVRYKRSVLGVLWSFLNPLLMMAVQYVVFSQLFKSDIDNYPVYLLSGLVVFNFFSEGAGQALGAVVGNAQLITKVYVPKYIYPAAKVLSSGINLVMSLVPFIIAALATGEQMTKAYLMLPYILLCVMAFTAGIGMALAAAMAFFRDVQFLWGIVSMLWMYLTPLFYPVSIVPDEFRAAVMGNPMYFYVSAVRSIVMEGITPRPAVFCQCTLAALVMLGAGCLVFKKTQDKFVFYI